MRRLRDFAGEIVFCVVGAILVWIAIDWFGGPDLMPMREAEQDYIEE